MKIRPEGAELFHADGETDTTKLIVDFRNIANTPKNSLQSCNAHFHAVMTFFRHHQTVM
jgi:hypothetical protein